MDRLAAFFIFCSGCDERILKQAPTEFNKYVGIGATVFFTGLFAMVASGYALYTVFGNWFSSLLFAVLWGLLIFNLDRYIVSSMKKKGSFFADWTMAMPRIVLAVIISMVISKPLELKIFETEIYSEIVSMQQERRKQHEDLLNARFAADLKRIDGDILRYKSDLESLKKIKDTRVGEALSEADGTGGSKIRNMGPIYKAKQQAASLAEEEYAAGLTKYSPLLMEKETEKKKLLAQRDTELANMQKVALTGFASRMEALDRVAQKSYAVFIAGIFIMLLFIAIETAPMFVKVISERSPYDYLLDKIEHEVALDHKEITSLRSLEVNQKLHFEHQTRSHRNQELIKAENELFTHAINSEMEELKNSARSLKDYLSRGSILKDAKNI
jgi:Domain of unknown function (DUF4407)